MASSAACASARRRAPRAESSRFQGCVPPLGPHIGGAEVRRRALFRGSKLMERPPSTACQVIPTEARGRNGRHNRRDCDASSTPVTRVTRAVGSARPPRDA
eukprot:IDg16417t1